MWARCGINRQDLAQIAFNKVREREFAKHDSLAQKLAVDKVIDSLVDNLKETYHQQERLDEHQLREDIRRSVEQGGLNDQKIKLPSPNHRSILV